MPLKQLYSKIFVGGPIIVAKRPARGVMTVRFKTSFLKSSLHNVAYLLAVGLLDQKHSQEALTA